MGLSLFTLGDIKEKVRNLTGRKSVNQLSDVDLLKYINRYYRFSLPMEIRPRTLQSWFEFNTVVSDEHTPIENNILVYPNPTDGKLIVSSTNNLPLEIKIHDLSGRLVMSFKELSKLGSPAVTKIPKAFLFSLFKIC